MIKIANVITFPPSSFSNSGQTRILLLFGPNTFVVGRFAFAAGPTDCVAGSGLDAIRATVQVTIPVLTMTGASTEPVLLAGYGPIAPDTAAVLAAGAPGWERVMTSR